ncbi:MAG: leucyl aminopeptidase [Deltaproteobacteria bacterium]|nr:leucyl aminopeptidase [Deltaproteobacteria bacterium]
MSDEITWQVQATVEPPAAGLRVFLHSEEREFFLADDRLGDLADRVRSGDLKQPFYLADRQLAGGDYLVPLAAFKGLNIWEAVKTGAARALSLARELKIATLTLVLDARGALGFHKKALEGILLGAYRYRAFKREEDDAPAPLRVNFAVGSLDRQAVAAELERTTVVCGAVNRVRELVNHPAAVLGPEELAAAGLRLATDYQLQAEVWDENRLAAAGYNGLLAVGRGSVRPPRLVELRYTPAGESRAHVALVGKGITFDSGGLSLKPAAGMETMKRDMAGAAAVLGALEIVAALRPPVTVTGILCLAENMPDARAQRPGDIITMKNGKTVEVKNTDAEGRLVLADGLLRAAELQPDYLVDIATLTGACLVALGDKIAGVLGDQPLVDRLLQAGRESGEILWQLPLEPGYREDLRSDFADLANVGANRYGGTIRGALFLREFVPAGIPWAHIDIAGPSFVDKKWKYFVPGATGFGARVLAGLVKNL